MPFYALLHSLAGVGIIIPYCYPKNYYNNILLHEHRGERE